MIPAIFRGRRGAIAAGRGRTRTRPCRARRISGAASASPGLSARFGGLLINLAFRQSFLAAKSGTPAFWAFLAFYAVCFVVTYVVYMRSSTAATDPTTGAKVSLRVRVGGFAS